MKGPATIKVSVFAAAGVLVLAGLIGAFRYFGTGAPVIPSDQFHELVVSNAGCTVCHTPGSQVPLGASHPPAVECMSCHK